VQGAVRGGAAGDEIAQFRVSGFEFQEAIRETANPKRETVPVVVHARSFGPEGPQDDAGIRKLTTGN